LAETVLTGVESYLGLHYPASDIPLPARAVFLKNWVRTIPDVNYEPVPLQPRDNPVTRAPLDLGVSLLRAVSPTHIEYLKNMRVGASLTISLVVEGKLWGLIACHHLSKKLVSMEIRDACESIGRMASAFISVRVQADSMAERSRFRKIHEVLVANIKNSRDMAAELTQSTPNLLDLISASGSSAALYLDGYWGIVGSTPPEDKLELLVDWLSDTHPEKTVYSTQALAEQFPGAVDFLPQWCGVLAISIPKSKRNYIFWFRPEVKGTVNWAGKLEKSVDAMGRLHPRGSFAVWQQAVEGKSTAWSEIEIETALQLRNEIMASDLREQFQREQDARIEAVRATKAREELMAVLSHDLKNPIGSIRLGAQFATKFLNPESFEKVRTYLSRIERATVSMDSLINDILSITKLEAGFLSIEKEMVGIDELIREVMDLVAPIANDKQIQMVSNFKAATCETVCDRNQMFQVISNILGNAIKFTPEHGKISIVLEECGPEYVKIAVTDSGPGIPPENLANVFDRFWQAQQTKRFGTGLGLTIVKGIVENHGGKVWAESDGKTGTTFHFTLPMIRKVRRS
jgi:chemotaxis family two-component system sensor kinase Cph1